MAVSVIVVVRGRRQEWRFNGNVMMVGNDGGGVDDGQFVLGRLSIVIGTIVCVTMMNVQLRDVGRIINEV